MRVNRRKLKTALRACSSLQLQYGNATARDGSLEALGAFTTMNFVVAGIWRQAAR